MTGPEATARAAELNRDEQGGQHWFARRGEGDDYEVVAVALPGLPARGELKATVLSRPEPTEPPDPRPTLTRNVPPYGAG